ncbi:hypothetical protein [Nocardia abscessus]|uniref:hypothetical protein n=1 Tax=Nocardia abscessus TaxID=120957 RepID=UPI0024541AED|nr:hypothetical protein [Nocardia abscessus]
MDHTVNFMRRREEEFTDAVFLDGWEQRSLWGWEIDYYWVQLWRDENTDEQPDFWITGTAQPLLQWPGDVTLAIMRKTQADPLSIARALRILPPPPVQSPLPAIQEGLAFARDHSGTDAEPDDWITGQIDAYEWVSGRRSTCPGSGRHWPGGTPSSDDVAAEWYISHGMCHDPDVPSYRLALGVNEALTAAVTAARGTYHGFGYRPKT